MLTSIRGKDFITLLIQENDYGLPDVMITLFVNGIGKASCALAQIRKRAGYSQFS